ncbi:MAG: DUF3592 domain-containing protein [bacterium]|nr:DUF3592 domain-containing protein [bacterium]
MKFIKIKKCIKKSISYFGAVVFFIGIFSLFFYSPIKDIIIFEMTETWIPVTGQIDSVELEAPLLSNLNHHNDHLSYSADIKYSYSIHSNVYYGSCEIDGPFIYESEFRNGTDKDRIENFKKKYPIGGDILIEYNPEHIGSSIISFDYDPYEKLWRLLFFIFLVVSAFFLLFFVGYIYTVIRNKFDY